MYHGQVGVIATDGGAHPPARWAEVTASQIISVSETAPEAKVREVNAFYDKLVEMLSRHHGRVQQSERAAIAQQGDDRLQHDLSPLEHVDGPVNDIVALGQDYPSIGPFLLMPEIQDQIRALLASHFATSMNEERAWHAVRNPETPQAKAFMAAQHPGA